MSLFPKVWFWALTTKMLRVAFLHPDLGLGGAERLVVDAAAGLAKLVSSGSRTSTPLLTQQLQQTSHKQRLLNCGRVTTSRCLRHTTTLTGASKKHVMAHSRWLCTATSCRDTSCTGCTSCLPTCATSGSPSASLASRRRLTSSFATRLYCHI